MLRFQVINRHERQQMDHEVGPIEFGRGPRCGDIDRCVIRGDMCVSKDHMRVEELSGGRIRIRNLSQKIAIWIADNNTIIGPGETREMALPVRLNLGETWVEILMPGPRVDVHETLATIDRPIRPKSLGETLPNLLHLGSTPTPATLTLWFETIIAVQRAAAGSAEFYEQTARALITLVGMDQGLVLLRRGEDWEVAARVCDRPAEGREYSRSILRRVVEDQRTFYLSGAPSSPTKSLDGIEAVVVSPIFGPAEKVVGAIYGSRRCEGLPDTREIGPLHAQVVQLLASAVGAGLARLEREAEASRLRVQFEQFFSADLARELQHNPDLLVGQERTVTVLFADIREFSRLAEQLGPRESCRLVSIVMERLTDRIREYEGVLVDYLGDGLLAMWNAPAKQEDHAVLACRAALAMLADMPRLSVEWRPVIGSELNIGIGLNTGPALVGNIGSAQKFKYGPLGHTVNLGSRVQGASKQLRIPALLTGPTRELLGDGFATRRLCRVRVVGVTDPIELYELHAEGVTPEWQKFRDTYESALGFYEAGKWSAACRAIYPLLVGQEGRYDVPSLNLVARSVDCLKTLPESFDPVFELTNK